MLILTLNARGGNGSMMIEVVVSRIPTQLYVFCSLSLTSHASLIWQPFFHILVNTISDTIGDDVR